jgi:hypothetical protein
LCCGGVAKKSLFGTIIVKIINVKLVKSPEVVEVF